MAAREPERCREGFQRYTVVPGDTMAQIAARYNVTADFLSAENPHIPDPNVLYPGDVLCVPGQVTPPGTGRVPASCPQGFERYTVVAGDTMQKIAQRLGVDTGLLIANNLHITDPNIIFVGDVLCVPLPLTFPCCAVLTRTDVSLPSDAGGVALAQRLGNGNHLLTIMAVNLPPPSSLGDFDSFEGFVGIPGIGGFGFGLFSAGGQPSLRAGAVELKPLLTSGDQLYVIPSNSRTGASGRPVLQGNLSRCRA